MQTKTSYYLLHLQGYKAKDQQYILVGKTLWDWVHDKRMPGRRSGQSGWHATDTPPETTEGQHGEDVFVSIGSFNNDKALACAEAKNTETFYDTQDFVDFLAKGKIKIIETYDGHIY